MLDAINQLFGLIVRHQISFFLILGALLNMAIRGFVLRLPRIQAKWIQRFKPIYADSTLPKMLTLLYSGVTLTALTIGNQQPLPKTTVLTFPKPACNHGKSKLLLFLHGWRGDSDGTWQRFPSLVCNDSALTDVTVLAIDYPV